MMRTIAKQIPPGFYTNLDDFSVSLAKEANFKPFGELLHSYSVFKSRFSACTVKVPKFSDAIKLCCNLSKIETKRPNLRVLCQKHVNGIANSENPDQTAPLGAV